MFRVFFFLGCEFYGIICCAGAKGGGIEGGGCASGSAMVDESESFDLL